MVITLPLLNLCPAFPSMVYINLYVCGKLLLSCRLQFYWPCIPLPRPRWNLFLMRDTLLQAVMIFMILMDALAGGSTWEGHSNSISTGASVSNCSTIT